MKINTLIYFVILCLVTEANSLPEDKQKIIKYKKPYLEVEYIEILDIVMASPIEDGDIDDSENLGEGN